MSQQHAIGVEAEPLAVDREHPTRCPNCGQHFSPDGRFCPFDGEPLVRAADWDPAGDPWLDRVVEHRYHVEAVIGEGGMGTVYRVRHVLLGKHLALKALRADLANDPEIAARFIHEARTAASLSHPGLVQISDFGLLPSGQAYLVMELLEGAPLGALLRRHGAFAPSRALLIARQLAEALAFAHDAGVVHRDLKPDNVHVRSVKAADEVKVVDFGLARVVGSSRLTRKGMVFGTPHYMSPEQAQGHTSDPRSDLYSLGIVLYEMLVGRVPFEADTYRGVLTQHIYLKPVPPSERLGKSEGLAALERITLKCLEKDPARRYRSMRELIEALDAIPDEALGREPPGVVVPRLPVGVDGLPASEGLPVIPRRAGARVLLGGALLGCAALGALLVRWVLAPAPEQAPSAAPSVWLSAAQPASALPAGAIAPPRTRSSAADQAPSKPQRADLSSDAQPGPSATGQPRKRAESRPGGSASAAPRNPAGAATGARPPELINPWANTPSGR